MKDFNFFEPYIYTKRSPFKLRYLLLLLIALSLVLFAYNARTLSNLNLENEKLLEDIQDFQDRGVVDTASRLRDEQENLISRLNAVNAFDTYNNEVHVIDNDLFVSITGLIPEEMYFSEWMFAGNIIQMTGFAYDRTVIAEFESELRANGYEDLYIGQISETNETGVPRFDFSISFSVGGAN